MPKQKCIACSEYRNCKDTSLSWIFFIIGLIATISVRAVMILVHVDRVYGQIAWYIGVVGFFIFFAHKFKVEHIRSQLIKKSRLMDKISQDGVMEKSDRELISSLLCALSSSKDKINYLVIFTSSIIAIAIAVYLDFIK